MNEWTYVCLAYGVTYAALLGYTIQLWRRRGRADAALRSDLHRREG